MIHGQRFEVDLDGDDEPAEHARSTLPGAFVADVLERKAGAPKPPSAPTLKSRSGFPEHRKRNVGSIFKQQSSAVQSQDSSNAVPVASQQLSSGNADPSTEPSRSGESISWEEEEKRRIDTENRQKLAQMSPEEIEEERQELMNSLSPALVQRLLQRSNIDSGSTETNFASKPDLQSRTEKPKRPEKKSVSFAEDVPADDHNMAETVHQDGGDLEDGDRDARVAETLPHETVHFPRPQQPPDLDPTSETFLEDLHQKYFPSLPSDPDKLEWMQPSTSASKNSYDPNASAVSPKNLRFSFKGELIPPRTASEIPVTAGLHHHGDAPYAAGYTITELVHLARSSFAAQRCIAFQTLGRMLYRLGKGEFGDSGEPGAGTVGAEDSFGELARGLWREVEKEKVIETLVTESEGKGIDGGRHVSARAYATEAVWLWRKSGGRRWKAE